MARRDALRDLQSRLSERLQAARTDRTARRGWLALECAGVGLLVPLESAGEIFPLSPLMPVPHTQPWFLGVANLRGQLHGVVDLAAFLQLRAPLSATSVRDQSQIVAFNPKAGAHCAVLVDRLCGLRNPEQLTADLLQPEPAQSTGDEAVAARSPTFAGARWCDDSGRRWHEIDLSALARHPRFRSITT